MRTLKSMTEANIKQAKQEIAKSESIISKAKEKMSIDNDNIDDYRRASVLIDIEKQGLNYWRGVLVMAQQVFDYTSIYIDQEEIEFELAMDEVPTELPIEVQIF